MKKNLSLFTFIALLMGIVFGLFFSQYTEQIAFIGTWYITFLKYMIVPVVFTSITVSVYDSRNLKNRMIVKTVLLFAAMFIATFLLSSLIVMIVDPSRGFVLENRMADHFLYNKIPPDGGTLLMAGPCASRVLSGAVDGT